MKLRTIFRKIRKCATILLLAVISLLLYINIRMYLSARDAVVSGEDLTGFNPDCILVLGASVRGDGTPSPMLQDRLDTAISLYQSGAGDRLLMSGDRTDEYYDEVGTMKAYAVDAGVPSEDIFLDPAGLSTYESLYRAKYLFGAERIVIVTQSYHLYRALYLAEALGLDAVGVSCDTIRYSGQILRDIREVAARAKDFYYAMIQPALPIPDEKIPITGDGDVTNDLG